MLLLYRRGFNPDNFTAPLPAARGGFLCAGVQEREQQRAESRWQANVEVLLGRRGLAGCFITL